MPETKLEIKAERKWRHKLRHKGSFNVKKLLTYKKSIIILCNRKEAFDSFCESVSDSFRKDGSLGWGLKKGDANVTFNLGKTLHENSRKHKAEL